MSIDRRRGEEALARTFEAVAIGLGLGIMLKSGEIGLVIGIVATVIVLFALWCSLYWVLGMSPHYPPD